MAEALENVDYVVMARAALDRAETLTREIEGTTRKGTMCREAWLHYGQALLMQRQAMISNKEFGGWVHANGLDAGLAADPAIRSNAMWMAEHSSVLQRCKITNHHPTSVRRECRDAGYDWAFDQRKGAEGIGDPKTMGVAEFIVHKVFAGNPPQGFSRKELTKNDRWARRAITNAFGEPLPKRIDPSSAMAARIIEIATRVHAERDPGGAMQAADAAIADAQQSVAADIEKSIAAHKAKLEAEFAERLAAAAEAERLALKARLVEADEEYRAAKAEREAAFEMRLGIDSHMTMDEFKLVLGCLHPDKHPDAHERYAKAFAIFKRLERTVNTRAPISVMRQRGWEKANPFYKG